MHTRKLVILLTVLPIVILANSSATADAVSDPVKMQVNAALDHYHESIASGNLPEMVAFFSDSFSNSQGATKAMMVPFFSDPGVQAVMSGQKTIMDKATYSIDADVVTVTPISYESPIAPTSTWTYRLKKEADGVWRLINSEPIP